MMNPTTFKTLFTEFAAEADVRVQQFLDFAWEELGTVWDSLPTRKDRAQGLLAAHMLVSFNKGSNAPGGPITAESVGDLSRSYGQAGTMKTNLATTFYGQEFDRLQRMSIVSAYCLS